MLLRPGTVRIAIGPPRSRPLPPNTAAKARFATIGYAARAATSGSPSCVSRREQRILAIPMPPMDSASCSAVT